jgi:hypothetical protein
MSTEAQWTEVDLGIRPEWRRIFNGDIGLPDIKAPCPVCGSATLHRWYAVDERRDVVQAGARYLGLGRLWEWCSTCHSFEHYPDGFVPHWWSEPYEVKTDVLKYDPGPIELRRAARRGF